VLWGACGGEGEDDGEDEDYWGACGGEGEDDGEDEDYCPFGDA
jgi:hypothetical protein